LKTLEVIKITSNLEIINLKSHNDLK